MTSADMYEEVRKSLGHYFSKPRSINQDGFINEYLKPLVSQYGETRVRSAFNDAPPNKEPLLVSFITGGRLGFNDQGMRLDAALYSIYYAVNTLGANINAQGIIRAEDVDYDIAQYVPGKTALFAGIQRFSANRDIESYENAKLFLEVMNKLNADQDVFCFGIRHHCVGKDGNLFIEFDDEGGKLIDWLNKSLKSPKQLISELVPESFEVRYKSVLSRRRAASGNPLEFLSDLFAADLSTSREIGIPRKFARYNLGHEIAA